MEFLCGLYKAYWLSLFYPIKKVNFRSKDAVSSKTRIGNFQVCKFNNKLHNIKYNEKHV